LLTDLNAFSSALSVLTAMITPAVLMSACGTMILSTSTRLGRVVDRVRALSEKLEELAGSDSRMELYEERQAVIFTQLDKLTSRSRILQRCIVTFYGALCIFVSTSVAIGIVAASGARYYWIPVVMGLIGACFMFYGSMLLISESRLALGTIHIEMDFIWRLSQRHVPNELAKQHKPHFVRFRRHD
jgi:hypothetical protein